MSEPTEQDRDTAYRALWPLTRYRWPRDDEITEEQRGQVERVAAALAAEREKALGECAAWIESLASPTLNGDPFIRAADWAADLIRQAAEDTP